MRTLKFIVDGQILRRDPSCDFDGLVPGTEDYIQAEFVFSSGWTGFMKVVGFYSVLGVEYQPQILADGKTCVIPADALKRRTFKIQVIGKRDQKTLVTNKVAVSQNGD